MDMTPEEIEQVEKDAVNDKAREEAVKKANEDKANLKASAKAKLVAGEALTQEESRYNRFIIIIEEINNGNHSSTK